MLSNGICSVTINARCGKWFFAGTPIRETIVMAISLDQFTQQLADSGLMSSDEIASVVAGLRASSKPLDGEELARQLVRQKKLTA